MYLKIILTFSCCILFPCMGFSQFPSSTDFNQRLGNYFLSQQQLQYFDFKTNPPPRLKNIDTASTENMNIRTLDGMYLFSYPKSIAQLKYGYREIIEMIYGRSSGRKQIPYSLMVGPPNDAKSWDFIPRLPQREKNSK